MAYDEKLSDRIRKVLVKRQGVSEKKMFGGIAFMLHGNMCCGVVKDELMVRVGPQQYEMAIAEPHARPMDFTGRPLNGFIYVNPEGVQTEAALRQWVKRAADFAASLPKK